MAKQFVPIMVDESTRTQIKINKGTQSYSEYFKTLMEKQQ